MGDAISETFQTRADQIQTELQAFFVAKETLYQEVKHQIQMQQTLAQSMTALGTLVQHQLTSHAVVTLKVTMFLACRSHVFEFVNIKIRQFIYA